MHISAKFFLHALKNWLQKALDLHFFPCNNGLNPTLDFKHSRSIDWVISYNPSGTCLEITDSIGIREKFWFHAQIIQWATSNLDRFLNGIYGYSISSLTNGGILVNPTISVVWGFTSPFSIRLLVEWFWKVKGWGRIFGSWSKAI